MYESDPTQTVPFYSPQVYGWAPAYDVELAPHQDCPLCEAEEQIQDRAWQAYGMDKDSGRALRSLRAAGLSGVSEKQVRAHFRAHNFRQPQAPQASRAKMLAAAQSIPDGHGRIPKILQALSRQGALSHSQIVRLFFYPDTSSQDSAEKSAARMLGRMRFAHLIYPVRPDGQRSPETYYGLGAWALPMLEECDPQTPPGKPLAHREELPLYLLQGQALAAETFVQLRTSLYPRNRANRILEVYGKATPMHMNPESWWGSRSLLFADGDLRYRADGFACLAMNDGRKQQFQLPMLLEQDEGILDVEEVAKSAANYVELSRRGVPQSRFPQHQIERYHIPLLLVTNTPGRAERIRQQLGELVGSETGPMILVCDQQSFQDGAWEDNCWKVVGMEEDLGMNLAELLLAASRPLTQEGAVHWRSQIQFAADRGNAIKPHMPNWLS